MVVMLVGCGGGGLDGAIDSVREAAEDFCGCLPTSEQSTCLSEVNSLEAFKSCIESAMNTAGTSADFEGFVDCTAGKAEAAQSCIDGSGACNPGRVDECIELSGVYNCSAPESIRATIDACR
jgi:hypothetical protein